MVRLWCVEPRLHVVQGRVCRGEAAQEAAGPVTETYVRLPDFATSSVSMTHLLWIGRWVEVRKTSNGFVFKSGRDAADWLLR